MTFHNLQGSIEIPQSNQSRADNGNCAFEKPVIVLVGLGFPRSINSVGDALALLNDWPFTSRGAAHQVALNACRAALHDEIDAETARSTFEAFARKANILAPQFADLIASNHARSIGSGGNDASH